MAIWPLNSRIVAIPLGEKTDLFEEQSLLTPESISEDLSKSPQLEDQKFSGARKQNEENLTTEEQLDPGEPQTVTHQDVLFERMDGQQQSMENLTRAIHGLVEVLSQTKSSSISVSQKGVATANGQKTTLDV